MSKRLLPYLVCLAIVLASPAPALAGAKITIDDDSYLDLGFRLQALYRYTDFEDPSSGDADTAHEFLVRRARLRVKAQVTKWVSAFLQTESQVNTGTGSDMRILDAWVALHPHDLANLYLGQNMAPAGRQITTSSGASLTMDRPGITNYNLTWGLNGRAQFNTATFGDGNLPFEGEVNVRDLGATLFGTRSFTEDIHLKYYLGGYNGVRESVDDEDTLRFTGRVQLNLLDPEPGYFNSATYLGAKKTVALGASYDRQGSIATDEDAGEIDYEWFEIDAFAEYPLGPGSATFEAAYQNLDLDGATALIDGSERFDARRTEGDGFYVQGGYFITDWNLQPFAAYEQWNTEADDDLGSFDAVRAGLTYYIKGHNAKVSLGYERFMADNAIAGSDEDAINTVIFGAYVTY
jgi:hypothetical protein